MSSATEPRPADEPRERIARLRELFETTGGAIAGTRLSDFHPSDLADLLVELDEGESLDTLRRLPAALASEALAEMEAEEHPEELLAALASERVGELLAELSDDDAVDLIGELEPGEQARVLAALPSSEAGELRGLLRYDEESAGGIMTTERVAVVVHLSAGEAIREIRRQARELGGDFYHIFVIDLYRRLLGAVPLQELVLADPDTRLGELVEPLVATVPVDMDQEEVGRIIGRYNLPSIAVVGPGELLLGRITWDDVIDVLEAEQTEDILRFGGVAPAEEVRGGWAEAVRSRLPWLFINLLTAAVAASVIYFFQSTIDEILILVVILPIIAGMGGNAGTQALAVTVRRLALEEEDSARRWSVAGKELLVGMVNGAAIGATIGLVSYLWQDAAILGLVVFLAMLGNLIVASIAGAFVPILLERLGVDPAVASSVFVTTLTDLAGFFLLLGLATALLL